MNWKPLFLQHQHGDVLTVVGPLLLDVGILDDEGLQDLRLCNIAELPWQFDSNTRHSEVGAFSAMPSRISKFASSVVLAALVFADGHETTCVPAFVFRRAPAAGVAADLSHFNREGESVCVCLRQGMTKPSARVVMSA